MDCASRNPSRSDRIRSANPIGRSGSRPDVFVVGSINTDFIVRVERRPAPGETVAGSDLVTAAGGKGANQAVAVARLGGDVALLGRVGSDARGDALRETLRDAGVDDRFVHATPDAATGSALVMVTPDGENAIVVSPGANAFVDIADVEAATRAFDGARCVLLQLELHLDVVVHSLERAARAQKRAILNAAPAQPLPREVLALLDPLVVNEHEAAVLLGTSVAVDAAERAARALVALGARSVVITFGADGAAAATRDGSYQTFAATATRAVDATGAGDAFTGALALELARGAPFHAAVRFGVRAGTLAVQRLGAQASLPTRDEVESATPPFPR